MFARDNRIVTIASADIAMASAMRERLVQMGWAVEVARGGAEAIASIEKHKPAALITDFWLPDLEVNEFVQQVSVMYPELDHLRVDGTHCGKAAGMGAAELVHMLRNLPAAKQIAGLGTGMHLDLESPETTVPPGNVSAPEGTGIPELVGASAAMIEVARLIRLLAPRSTTVLIEGETGTGKEVVARALHRLSSRAQRPFVVLNCAAIPEALLESELFGHARGAFTGAVQSRVGRIEAAHGGTLFLDEIGEMPLALQAKMLRFFECGELQKVGDNETVRVDVRVIAATHQPLEQRSIEGTFRLDLYHRLAVFPLELPALRERREDIALLAEHLLAKHGKDSPRKRLSSAAMALLLEHAWPGNVRELGHVLERATILSEDNPEIGPEHIRVRKRPRGPSPSVTDMRSIQSSQASMSPV